MKLTKLIEYIASIFEFFILASLDILDTIRLKYVSKKFLVAICVEENRIIQFPFLYTV